MSISELLVIAIVALLLIKPEDLPVIIANLKKLKSFFNNTKREILSCLNDKVEVNDIADEVKEMNYYLEKIIKIEGDYSGQYSITSLKEHYSQLVKKTLTSDDDRLL